MSERRAAPAGLSRVGALAMALLLAVYIAVVGVRAVQFIATGEPIAIVIGIAVVVMFAVGVWALWREVVFGVQLDRAIRDLDAQGGMPDPLPATPAGKAERDAALEAFPAARADVQANENSWESWLRLAMAYDAARDRRRARHAARQAVSLRRGGRRERDYGGEEAP